MILVVRGAFPNAINERNIYLPNGFLRVVMVFVTRDFIEKNGIELFFIAVTYIYVGC